MPHPVIAAGIRDFLLHHRITDNGRHTFVRLAHAVAAIPWGKGRTIEEVLETRKVGTCTGKHLVLQSCLDALQIPSRIVVCTFRWSAQDIVFPQHLRTILEEGEWIHGHNFLQIRNDAGQWIDLDVTWDPPLSPYGFCALPEDWDGHIPFVGLREIAERWDGVGMEMKQRWIDALTEAERHRRDRFLRGLFDWVASLRSTPTT